MALRTARAGQRFPCVDARAAKSARAYCARAEAASISVSRALFDGVLLLVSYRPLACDRGAIFYCLQRVSGLAGVLRESFVHYSQRVPPLARRRRTGTPLCA